MSNYWKPAIADPNRLTDPCPVRGAPSEVRQAPNLPPAGRPVTAVPQQVDHAHKLPASDPGRGGNNPFTRLGKVKP